MRRAAILATRGLIVLALAAAVANLPLPGRSRARVRVHLIDRSGSVLVPGAPESLTPADARRIVEWDLRRAAASGDRILWASFGREVAFESETVDPEESRLEAALEAALARDPTEIVLHTDGRADPGRALLLCRTRGVPVHVFPLGPVNPRDARIADVRAPAALAPGERGTLEARLESTFETTLTVRLDGEARSVPVAPGAPSRVSFPDRPAGPFRLRLEPADACPQNDAAEGEIFVRSDAPRTLILSTRDFPAPEGFEARRSAAFEDPRPYDAVIVDGFPLNAEDAASLAAYVRDFGGALLLLGGPGAGGLPPAVAEISPLFPGPDRRVAAVFLIDASGSMKEGKLDAVLDAVRRAWARFGPGDSVAAVPFPNLDLIRDPLDLRRIRAEGGTFIAGALEKARLHLEQVEADRKQIFLLTDGETHPDEKAEERLLQGRELERRGIALTVVTTNRLLEIGENVRIDDWKSLDRALDRLLRTVREDYLAAPTSVEFADHPATAGLGRAVVPGIHRLRARPDAQVLGRAGRPPDVLPALAVRREGRGQVGAFAFDGLALPRLIGPALRSLLSAAEGTLTLFVDPPFVRARGRAAEPRLEVPWQARPSLESGVAVLHQVRSDLWEGPLPATRPGTIVLRLGRARAAATIPYADEYRAVGVDRKALERLAADTGGRILWSPEELQTLPRSSRPEPRPGRPFFLAAALVLVFLEMALTTFWKA
ncbi:MAG TPA: VWA domain-containing protein [Planctomycetota bacterium]|nr:VWA domain-containing protein [Planctomycetota bacterium]